MMEADSGGRVTQRELYDEITGLRQDMAAGFESLRAEMRGTYAVSAVCEQRHSAVEDAIMASASASARDRELLWAAVRENAQAVDDLKKKVYMGVGGATLIPTLVALLLHFIK